MNPSRVCLALGTLGALVSLAAPLVAAEGGRTVSVSGAAKVQRRPNLLRVRIQLTAKGKTVRDALTKLNDRREAARVKLAALGADKERIKFGDPIAAATDDDQREKMQKMVRARMVAGRGGAKGKIEVKPPAHVGATLTAEWPLAEDSADDTLARIEELREKIVDADLAGLKDFEKLSAEEEELAEEMGDQDDFFDNYNRNNGIKPGEPALLFVARISAAEHEKLLAAAYRDAHAKAQGLALAAAAKLGDLIVLSTPDSGAGGMMNPWRAYQMGMGGAGGSSAEEDEEIGDGAKTYEVSGPTPVKSPYMVTVQATFELK